MPDSVLPVPKTTPTLEEDFPTLKKDDSSQIADNSGEVAPPWFKPQSTPPVTETPPVTNTLPISNPHHPSQPTVSTPPSPPTPSVSVPTPTSNPFTPLGGNSSSNQPSGSSLPHIQYESQTNNLGGFETLAKVVSETPKKEDSIKTVNVYPDEVPVLESPKPKSPIVLIGIIVAFIITLSIPLTALYTVAYGYLEIPDKKLSENISNLVQSLPFTPKTPKFLITKSISSQKSITKESFDLSLAIRSKDLESVMASNQLDAAFKGNLDYSDPKNVKSVVNASITKDFNADVRSVDHKVYFRINKVPLPLLATLGISESMIQPVIKDWVYYDTTPLETEAGKILDTQPNSEASADELLTKITEVLFDDQIMERMETSEERLGKTTTHKITFNPDSETIDYLTESLNKKFNDEATLPSESKASDTITNLSINIWIEANTYYPKRIEVSFRIINNSPDPKLATQKTSSDVAIAYSLSEIGKDFKVEIPENSISLDQFIMQVTSLNQ